VAFLFRAPRFAIIALSCIFAGAGGNLIDRVRLGEVIDFLDVYRKNHHWPAFNVADMALCLGALLYLAAVLL
jgi:signal peptidase II